MDDIKELTYETYKKADSLVGEWYTKLSDQEKEALYYHSLRQLVFSIANEIFKVELARRNDND